MSKSPTFDVLVPRRADEGWRDHLWDYVRLWWIAAGVTPIEGHQTEGPFNRSRAINLAAHCSSAEYVVIVDADAVPNSFDQVTAAVRLAALESKLVRAYSQYNALDKPGTQKILNGYRGSWEKFIRWSNPDHLSSCIVVPRKLFDRLGGFDERFVGWGFEDRAFFEAADVIAGGTLRTSGNVWHLWHPRSTEKDPSTPEYRANQGLSQQYRAARDVDAVLEIISQKAA